MIGQLLVINISSFPAYSFTYSIPYLILGLLVCVIGWPWIKGGVQQPFPKKRLLLIMGLFLLFFGLRWHIMSDTIRYNEIYDDIDLKLSLAGNVAQQPFVDFGYMFIMMVTKYLNCSYPFFIFINSLVDFILFYYCIKRYSVNAPLSCLAFLAFQGIYIEANLLRNFKAILIFLLSLKYIEEQKLGKYLLCQVIAVTLHMTSIIFVPLYWLLNKRWNFKVVLAISIFATFIYLFASDLLANLTNNILGGLIGGEGKLALLAIYSTGEKEMVLSIGTLERLFFLFLTLMLYRKMNDKKGSVVMFANMYLIYFVLFAFFGFNYSFRDRIPLLFMGAYWLLTPILVERFRKKIPYLATVIILLSFLKIYASTRICSAYYETVLFHQTTVEQRQQLNDMLAD